MIGTILLIIACIAFGWAAFGRPQPPVINLIALGLFLWVLSILLGGAVLAFPR